MAFTFKHGDRPLKDYEVQRGVGRGGFGEVYYAVSDGGREVALKYLHSNQEIELRGIAHCMNLKSPHLVDIFDVVKNDAGEIFVIMEHIRGPSLRDILMAEPSGIGVDKATFFLKGIARGLGYLHDRGIVHRDLKPGNIFYEDGYVKIGDYGLSKFISQSAPGGNTASIGTVAYMAPEVGSGNYSRSIDIYALGVMLYEMMVGKVPFEGHSAGEVLMKHLMDQPEVEQLPAPFPQVIRKALAKDPLDRYQRVSDLLDEVLGSESVQRSLAGFDADSLSRAAARVAADVRVHSQDIPVPTAPDHRPFEGSSVVPDIEPPGLQYADRQRPGVLPGTQLRVRYAGFWIRFLAVIIDVCVLVPVYIIGGVLPASDRILVLAYSVLLLTYWNGQTIGKRACGIRVIEMTGRPLTLWRALAREVSKYISMPLTFGIGYIMAGVTQRKQGLHDMIASTVVIYAEETVPDPQSPAEVAFHRERMRRRQENVYDRQAPRQQENVHMPN